MNVLIALALVSCISSVHSLTDKPYLLASVLFYCDGHGNEEVANSRVSMKVDKVIRNDIRARISNATVKVVPIFKTPRLSPSAVEVIGFMNYTNKAVLVTKLPAALAHNLVAEHKKRLMIQKHKSVYLNTPVKRFIDEIIEINYHPEKMNSKTKFDDLKNKAKVAEKFLPNSVYYSIETKCSVRSEECDKLEASITKKSSCISLKNPFLKKTH